MPDFTLRTHYHRQVAGADVCGECGRPLDGRTPRPVERFVPGDVVTIDDPVEIERLVKAGAIDDPDAPVAAVTEPLDEPPAEGSGEAAAADPEAGGRPPKAGAKGAWVDYAVSRGLDRTEAEAMSKEDLIAAVGD